MQEGQNQQGQATPPAEGQPPAGTPPANPAEGQEGQSTPPAEGQIPYSKFQKKNEELKAAQAELEKFRMAEKAKQEEELKKNQQFETLLKQKEEELAALQTTVAKTEAEKKQYVVRTTVLDKIRALDPINADDILAFVDLSKFDIGEDGKIPGLDEVVQKLKTEKPYLFKTGKANPSENGKPNPGGQSPANPGVPATTGGFVMDALAKLR